MKNQITVTLLSLFVLAGCGKDGKIVTALEDTKKDVTKTKLAINANGPSALPLSEEDFKNGCLKMKGYGPGVDDTREGVILGKYCAVQAGSAAYDNTRSPSASQEISSGIAEGSLLIANGSVSNGTPLLITLDGKPFLKLGERVVAPAGGGRLAFYTVGRQSDVTLAVVSIWDCYDRDHLAKVICPKEIVP